MKLSEWNTKYPAQERYAKTDRGRAVRAFHASKWLKANRVTVNNGVRNRAKERRAFINHIKIERGCCDCGFNAHAEALDFDHRDPKSKSFSVSKMCDCSVQRIEEEIAKCDVRCANCHRIKTAKERDI